MTSQTKHFIELSDIVALRFECKHCHATVSLPISADIKVESLRICPNCNEPWARLPEGSTIELAIKKFIDDFKNFEDLLRRRSEFLPESGFLLCIEIKSDAAQPTDKK